MVIGGGKRLTAVSRRWGEKKKSYSGNQNKSQKKIQRNKYNTFESHYGAWSIVEGRRGARLSEGGERKRERERNQTKWGRRTWARSEN